MKKIFSIVALALVAMTASAKVGYQLTVGTSEHGTIAFKVNGAAATTADEGQTVTVEITPDKDWSTGAASGQWYAAAAASRAQSIDMLKDFELTAVEGNENAYTFVMKRANAEISVTYRKQLTHEDIGISGVQPVTYNGKAQTPAVTVKDDASGTLTLNTDYTAEYTDNTNAGEATVTLKGIGDKYAGEWVMHFTIQPAALTAVTLDQTEFTYNFKQPAAQTAKVTEVKAGELTVPATDYEVAGNSGTELGTYTVTVTGKNNFTGKVTADFAIVKEQIDVKAEETETGKDVTGVNVEVSVADRTAQTLVIDRIVENASVTSGDITVEIPAQVSGWDVIGIGTGAMDGLDNVTDIVMPDTEEPLEIAEGALIPTATIHTTLALLDDYALMLTLKENYEATKVMTTVAPANKYWTLGTGCDVIIPEGLRVYTVHEKNTAEVATEIIDENLLTFNGERIVKANNGVLLLGAEGQSYDLFAFSGRLSSGLPVATQDNKDYGQTNLLEPVVEKKHYESGHYFVLQDNEFHSILVEGDEVKVPAGKAVLRLGDDQVGATSRSLAIGGDATGIESLTPTHSEGEGVWYDLQGRRVVKAQKGLYIINGKKVIVK